MLVSSPIHLDAFLRAGTEPVVIARILSATAPMSQQLALDLERNFQSRVTEIFGCSEAGSLAWRETGSETEWHIMEAFDIEVANGRARVRAGHLPDDVPLSDQIELLDGRRFRWLGRDQDMINIAGKRGSLAHLNHQLSSVPGVVDGVIFLPAEDSSRLAALVVAPDVDVSAILDALRTSIEPAFLPRPLYKVAALPRQETGKLARQAMLDLYEAKRREARDNGKSATDIV